MTLFEQVLAEAVISREQQEKAYNEKREANFKSFNELCQMTDLLNCNYRHRGMNNFHGRNLSNEELKESVLSRGGVA